MALGRSALLASALVSVGLAAAAATADAVTIANVSQNTTTAGVTQSGRIFRNGVTSTCEAPKATPGGSTVDPTGSYKYLLHTFRSSLLNPICFQVDIDTACPVGAISSAAYTSSFNPSDISQNYVADMGTSTAYPAYSFVVQPGSFFGVNVHATSTSPSCGAYSVVFSARGPWARNRPQIYGQAALGSTLSGTDSDWIDAPAVDRTWQRCDADGQDCQAIPGATDTTYTVATADIGHTLRLRNDVTDADGASATQSEVVDPFIPFATQHGALGPGDRFHSGIFVRTGVETRCSAPMDAPTILQAAKNFSYESYAVTNLLNQPVCLAAYAETPALFTCFGVTPEIFNPAFDPAAGLAHNYAANSGGGFGAPGAASTRMGVGESREVVVSNESSDTTCESYDLTVGADAPFATARPAVSGEAVAGGLLTAGDGTWSGTPALTRAWLRCDEAGAACEEIAGAGGASYAPAAADVGRRLRVRVTATQGRSVSSDSEPSAPIARDSTPPAGTLRLLSRNLKKAAKSGRIPIEVSCNEACGAVVDVKISKRLARRLGLKKRTRIAHGRVAGMPAGQATRVRAKLTKAARRALRRQKAVKVTVVGVLTDAAANHATLNKRAALKRPRR